jgi:hypothetical protein
LQTTWHKIIWTRVCVQKLVLPPIEPQCNFFKCKFTSWLTCIIAWIFVHVQEILILNKTLFTFVFPFLKGMLNLVFKRGYDLWYYKMLLTTQNVWRKRFICYSALTSNKFLYYAWLYKDDLCKIHESFIKLSYMYTSMNILSQSIIVWITTM